MDTKIISIESTQQALKDWRASKTHSKQPMPQNIRYMVKQLLSNHSDTELMQSLKIYSQTLNSIRLQSFYTDQISDISEQNTSVPERDNNFIPFKIVPQNSSSNTSTTCQFVKRNGDKLTITTNNINEVVKAFLCCN